MAENTYLKMIESIKNIQIDFIESIEGNVKPLLNEDSRKFDKLKDRYYPLTNARVLKKVHFA